jgi:Tol biopolymer transport system component
LRTRIFTSPEFLELTGTFDNPGEMYEDWTIPKLPANSTRRDTPGRPQLIAIPGGRSTIPTPSVNVPHPQRRSNSNALRMLFVVIAASIVLAVSIGTILGIYSWRVQTQTANNGAITPPIGPLQGGPLSAGMRSVFLRDGALWSTLANSSSKQADRLTPPGVAVAANWVVSPAQIGRSAGDMLAYIDLQKAYVHIIRSDGQQDTIIKLPLLNTTASPASVWDTDTGAMILNSLAWSSDGSMLAFVAASNKTAQTQLYIYSTETGITQAVPLSMKGNVSHPVWSPDGVRVAFELVSNGSESILDYNTQNHGFLTITSRMALAGDTVLSLDWSPSVDEPAVTWSEGVIGQVHSLWVHRVGTGGSPAPIQLLSDNFVQAIYSRNGNNGTGSWLLVSDVNGQAGDLWRIDSIAGSVLVRLTTAKQVSFAQWSTDGMRVDYLDALTSGVGRLHVVDTQTGIDSLLATGVVNNPIPAWSSNGQELVFSTGTRIGIVNLQAANSISFLKLQGVASSFAWSVTSPHQVVISLHDTAQGIYLVDTVHNTSQQMDTLGATGPIEWTEIP